MKASNRHRRKTALNREDGTLNLEEALQAQEEQVDALLRSAGKYVSALKSWKKACQVGHLSNLQKASVLAEEAMSSLPAQTTETKSAWQFDVRGYLINDDWRVELLDATTKIGLRTLNDNENEVLISSPITVRSLPGRGTLVLGRAGFPTIRPKIVAAELKKQRDRSNATNSTEFLESLYKVCVRLSDESDPHAKFSEIYDLFCLTPGYKKETPPAAFAQQIYALHRSDIQVTRGGRKVVIEYPTGAAKERDVFSVISEDGRGIRYFNLYFV